MGKPYRFRTTVLGHLEISKALKEYGIGVATGEVCQNRVMFKQFLASGGGFPIEIETKISKLSYML